MPDATPKQQGQITWIDLTVPDATAVRDFYRAVVGWQSAGVDMGGYEDFNMMPADGEPVAGICHRRGVNADLPAAWMIYITVHDLDASIAQCRRLGGAVIAGPKPMGSSARYCVIQDPAGAVCGLFERKP